MTECNGFALTAYFPFIHVKCSSICLFFSLSIYIYFLEFISAMANNFPDFFSFFFSFQQATMDFIHIPYSSQYHTIYVLASYKSDYVT